MVNSNKVTISHLTTITATAGTPTAHLQTSTGADVNPKGSKPIELNTSVPKSTNLPESSLPIFTNFAKEDPRFIKSSTSAVERGTINNAGYEDEDNDENEYVQLAENSHREESEIFSPDPQDDVSIIKDIVKHLPVRPGKFDIHMKETTTYATQDEDSHFFFHLVVIALLVAIMYITYHNKRKVCQFHSIQYSFICKALLTMYKPVAMVAINKLPDKTRERNLKRNHT